MKGKQFNEANPDTASLRIPDGRTIPYAVLGHPVGHSLSPLLHNTAFAALRWNAIYLALDVVPERIPDVLPALEAMGFRGVNLTVPLKEAAYQALSQRDASAERVRSVNTVQFTDKGMVGHSTDGEGFLRAAREAFGEGPEGRNLFILGTGGAGRAVALASAAAGAKNLVLADADPDRASRAAEEVRAGGWPCGVRVVECGVSPREAHECDWIVQATPVGLQPNDRSPLPLSAFRPEHKVFDLVYGRADTPFTRAARTAGAQAVNGLSMLLYQGIRSFEIWTGHTPPVELLRATLKKAVGET